jgi:hypothetical protein
VSEHFAIRLRDAALHHIEVNRKSDVVCEESETRPALDLNAALKGH